MKKLINGKIFNGRHFTGDSVVYVEGDRITGLSASSDTQDQPETEVIDLNGGYLVPGFIDLHVMGGSGVYFSNEPTADAIERTDRRSVVAGRSVTVRVDLGGGRYINIKKRNKQKNK